MGTAERDVRTARTIAITDAVAAVTKTPVWMWQRRLKCVWIVWTV